MHHIVVHLGSLQPFLIGSVALIGGRRSKWLPFAEFSVMSDFKGRRFPTDIILVCVRWYCKYGIRYSDLEEVMSERVRFVNRLFHLAA